jgi:hypothetical protein
MEIVIVKLEDKRSDKQVLKFTTRIDSAVDMLDLTNKLRTEQETEGPWDEFISKLKLPVAYATVSTEFFRGISDIIFEVRMVINTDKDVSHKVNLLSEEIAGTFIRELKEYMGWWGLRLDSDYDTKVLKDLLVFRYC